MSDANPIGDRGPHPKNPGDKAYDQGDEITLEAQTSFSGGDWAAFDGAGGVVAPDDANDLPPEVIVGHDADSGDPVKVHTGGVVLANSENANTDATKVDDVGGDPLYRL